MRDVLKAFKADLKARAAELRQHRIEYKYKPESMRLDFRVRHITYCLLRGKTWEQVESIRAKTPPADTWTERFIQKKVSELLDDALARAAVEEANAPAV